MVYKSEAPRSGELEESVTFWSFKRSKRTLEYHFGPGDRFKNFVNNNFQSICQN